MTPRQVNKTSEEVRRLVRAGVTKDGAVAIAELTSGSVASHIKDWVSTQSLAIDAMLDTPGMPCGRIIEIFGKNHSGKSTAAAHLIAEVQRRGGVGYFVDRDLTADEAYFKNIGVKTDQLEMIHAKERSFEADVEAIEATVEVLRQYNTLAVIVYDDVAGVETRHDLNEKFGKVQPGGMAKGIRGMCRRLLSKIAGTRILIVVTNQVYSKVGVVFGNPEVPYGGDGLGIFASVRLHMRDRGALPCDAPGIKTQVAVIKSKVSKATRRKTDVAIGWGRGFDNVFSIYELLEENKYIAHGQSGACSMRVGEPAQEIKWRGGWPGLVNLCASDSETYGRLVDAYRAIKGMTAAPAEPGAPVEHAVEVEEAPDAEVEVAHA